MKIAIRKVNSQLCVSEMGLMSQNAQLGLACPVLVTRFRQCASFTQAQSSNQETGRILMLRINIQRNSRTATLNCRGRIVFGMETETLRSLVQSRTERVLEIDLAGIETIDASGLGLLIELQHWATAGNRILYFTNASDFVSRLVVLTHLYNVLVIAPGSGRSSREHAPAALSA